ncbi:MULTISPECIES: nuclear transport factor 2 family protein [Flavobacteriaceae]|uniref:nuclear transport factor 2 family protein n=1 Tax=Flavobacteriaceae TaxID=49546 RepID=UPI001BFF0426|nr:MULTISPECIES: nuclear transport factor 2 family protein [Flavobacteriaceae]MBT9189297.1 nuclear transport factor 2 family protein [Zobellia russellii]
MNTKIILIALLSVFSIGLTFSQTLVEQEIKELSKNKWQWMADKDTEKLGQLFHENAQYVHMGGYWGTERELGIIKSGGIWYKEAIVKDATVAVTGDTAILLNTITLVAEVGGNEVTNPFVVTEVYQKIGGSWKLLNLSFVKQMVRE